MADYKIPGEWINDGVLYGPGIRKDALSELKTLEMKSGDVLITAYPKAGITWLTELVWLTVHNGDLNKARSLTLFERVPFLEYKLSGVTELEKLQRPYVMKTHLRSEVYREQMETGKVKIVIGIRNPKDTLVSLYHFYRMLRAFGPFKGSWDDFFELYKKKRLVYGEYFDWYADWLQHKDNANVMLIKYEDMHHKMADVIKNLCQFLGKQIPENVISDMMQYLTFDSMSHNDKTNFKDFPCFDASVSPFIRKGKVGDWKNYFSEEQSAHVDKRYKDVIEAMGVTLEFE